MGATHKGMLMVVSGPSGTGKGTLCDMLLKNDPNMRFSVSVTTRQARDYEREGVHYYFVSDAEYDEMLEKDLLLEHATVHGHRYGTPRKPVEALLDQGFDVLLDIDPQGARMVGEHCPEAVSVFILPPSWKTLRERLYTRNTEDSAEIEKRLRNARGEVETLNCYDYAVVNEEGEEGKRRAYEAIRTIVEAERHATTRYFPVIE